MTNAVELLRSALAGRYAIDHELGRGGMAAVWLEHPRFRRLVETAQ